MDSKNKIDKIGKWSENKLSLLKKYLEVYTKIMKGKKWCQGYYYVDAFAGTGKPQAKDEERFIDGSPRCALTIKNPFTKYYFIEKTGWRVKELDRLKMVFKSLDIEIKEGDCNKILTQDIIPSLSYGSYKRALLFLDPFGMSVNWSVIKQASEMKTIEIILNMPIMAINRACLLNDPDKITKEHTERMNNFLGNNDWQNEIYRNMRTLFGTTKVKNSYFDAQGLSNYFTQKLKSIFSEVSSPLIMRNSKNTPLYCLIYAGHEKVAREIVESIFNRFKRIGK